MKKDQHQRKAYGINRMTKAVDRIIKTNSEAEKLQGRKWVNAWAKVAKIGPQSSNNPLPGA
jgi:hypothetical protein